MGGRNDRALQHMLAKVSVPGIQDRRFAFIEQGSQHGFEADPEILIGVFRCIAALLDREQRMDMLQRQDLLGQGHKEEVTDLVPEILFFDRPCHIAFFDIIAEHGGSHRGLPQRLQAVVDVAGDLVQIETDIGDLMIRRQVEALDRVG